MSRQSLSTSTSPHVNHFPRQCHVPSRTSQHGVSFSHTTATLSARATPTWVPDCSPSCAVERRSRRLTPINGSACKRRPWCILVFCFLFFFIALNKDLERPFPRVLKMIKYLVNRRRLSQAVLRFSWSRNVLLISFRISAPCSPFQGLGLGSGIWGFQGLGFGAHSFSGSRFRVHGLGL